MPVYGMIFIRRGPPYQWVHSHMIHMQLWRCRYMEWYLLDVGHLVSEFTHIWYTCSFGDAGIWEWYLLDVGHLVSELTETWCPPCHFLSPVRLYIFTIVMLEECELEVEINTESAPQHTIFNVCFGVHLVMTENSTHWLKLATFMFLSCSQCPSHGHVYADPALWTWINKSWSTTNIYTPIMDFFHMLSQYRVYIEAYREVFHP